MVMVIFPLRDGLKKKTLMEFSIKLAGCPGFPLKKTKTYMVLKHFVLPVEHFKAKLFFSPLWPPLTHPITKRGDVGLIKVKKQVDFKIHFRWFKAFLDHVFLFFFH